MCPSLEETVYLDFITSSSTGAAADADSTPTAEVFEDATDTTVVALTVTKRTSKTGNYRVPVACTAANGFEAGKSYNVIASATIGGVAAKCKIGTFQVRTRDTDDLATPTNITAATVTLADGVTHGGTTAKLRLGSSSTTPAFYVTNTRLAGSPAVQFEATGTGGTGFYCTGGGNGGTFEATNSGAGLTASGAGIGAGFIMQGGSTGAGWSIIGGSISGNVIDMTLTSGRYVTQAAEDEFATRAWASAGRTITGGTITTYTGNTPQTGDAYARIGATGSGLTSLAPASTALSTAQWTNALATALGTLSGHDPGGTLASASAVSSVASTLSTLLTTALTESYRGLNATGSVAQLLYEVAQHLGKSDISGTTKTVKNNAGAAAKTFTLDSATAATSITPAT